MAPFILGHSEVLQLSIHHRPCVINSFFMYYELKVALHGSVAF